MSVIWSNERGWIVCHSLFLHKIYNHIENEQLCSTCGRYRVFHIDQPFLKHGQKNVGHFDFCEDVVKNENAESDRNPDDDDEKNIDKLGNYSIDDFKLIEGTEVNSKLTPELKVEVIMIDSRVRSQNVNLTSKLRCSPESTSALLPKGQLSLITFFSTLESEVNFLTDSDSLTQILPTLFRKFMREFLATKLEYFVQKTCPGSLDGNISAINAANETLSRASAAAVASNDMNYDGANFNNHAIVANVKNETYFIPSQCRFYNYDIDRMAEKLDRSSSPPYDLILIDPPWPNKHVRRKNASSKVASGYNLMKADDLAEIPIDDYLSDSGLLAVWCTNSTQHVDALINRLFPRWNVHYVGTWYWIKVTQTAQPICEFSDVAIRRSKKQPFERIIFASRSDRSAVHMNPPPNKILVSIPSAIHSHKPPLAEVLKDYLPADSRCVELFARYLLPNWTSYGNEVIKLQSSSLFS